MKHATTYKTSFVTCILLSVFALAGIPKTLWALPGDSPDLRDWSSFSEQEKADVLAGNPWFGQLEVDGIEGAQAMTYLPVSLPAVWALMTDYESFADWIEGIEAITSVTRPRANLAYVGYQMSAIIKTLHYVLRRQEWPKKAQRWIRASGDLETVRGGYDFYPVGVSGTLIRFHTIVDPGVWVPGFIRRHFSVKGLRGLIRDINAQARKRYPDGGVALAAKIEAAQAAAAASPVTALPAGVSSATTVSSTTTR